MTPPRAWLKPDGTLPGVGTWTDTNNGSAEMAGAVEYAPVIEVAAIRSQAIREFCDRAGIKPSLEVSGLPPDVKLWRMGTAVAARRAAIKGDTP